jgi:murein DD-endopeptidase MepM/ murein hydrolase activator NlpD
MPGLQGTIGSEQAWVMKRHHHLFSIVNFRISLLAALTWMILGACTTIQTLTNTVPPSPHERYVRNLEKSDLAKTGMGKAWLAASEPALHDSIIVTLPFQETGYLPSSEPQARFYRFEVKEGQVLTLTSLVKSKEDVSLFIDVFVQKNNIWQALNYVDSTLTLTQEFDESGSCLVRLQPELLVDTYYSITLSVTPVLLNPVKGANNKSIGSFYGDPRDGGKRKHEGIDIFAPRGTPIVAPTAGIVTRVATAGLGGKIIWMNDTRRGHSYYFAHLDSQFVKAGAKVRQGDVIGTVGNTGNARYTPSHLHFGVYQKSSKDPIAYIRTMEKLVNELAPDTLFQSVVFRIRKDGTDVHAGPSFKSPSRVRLAKQSYVKVIGQSKEWYRIRTALDREGFIEKRNVQPAEKGTRLDIKQSTWLVTSVHPDATPIAYLEAQTVEKLAAHTGFEFVRTRSGMTGWVNKK